MSRKKKPQPLRSAADKQSNSPPGGFRPPDGLWPAAITALHVATPLIPSESAITFGSHAVYVVLWLGLLVAWCVTRLRPSHVSVRWNSTTVALLVFVILHSISAAVMARYGNPRHGLNQLWTVAGLIVGFLLTQQVFQSARRCRALCATMIGLSVATAAHGLYQYSYSLPQTRAQYAANAERIQQELGFAEETGTTLKTLFEQRLASTEPLGPFALTNSLAGFLTPWFVIVVALLLFGINRHASPRAYLISLIAGLLLAICLLLTESRAAYLATAAGVLLLAMSRWTWTKATATRAIAIAAGAICLALALLAIAAPVDSEMLSGAPKSLRFRLEYWKATADMIRDHPWLGCGPGQFQDYYTAYKLPQASETVADPHNFLLEIWATAGSPAAVAYVFALGAFLTTVIRREPENSVTEISDSASPFDVRSEWIYFGGLPGVALAWVGGLVVGFPPDLAIIFVGLPVAAVVIWGLHPWVQGGHLSVLAVAVAWLVMLINLLAAGGISFPGVAGSLYVLMAIGLNLVVQSRSTWGRFPNLPKQLDKPTNRQVGKPAPRTSDSATKSGAVRAASGRCMDLPRWSMAALAVLATAALAICYFTMYGPVLNSRGPFARGQQEHFAARQAIAASRPQVAQSHLQRAVLAFDQAAILDPWSPQPWFQKAGALHDSWQISGDTETWQAFEHAVGQSLRLQPRSFSAQMRVGHWYLLAYRQANRSRDLERALGAFSRAVQLYLNDAYARCQLAWAHHLSGEQDAATREARRALELDDLTPHAERKLRAKKMVDPGPRELGFGQVRAPDETDALQAMRWLAE